MATILISKMRHSKSCRYILPITDYNTATQPSMSPTYSVSEVDSKDIWWIQNNFSFKNTHTYLLETTDGISVIMYLIAAASNTEEIPGSNVDLYPKIIKYFLSIKNITFPKYNSFMKLQNRNGFEGWKHMIQIIIVLNCADLTIVSTCWLDNSKCMLTWQ